MYDALNEAKNVYYLYRQGENGKNTKHLQHFKSKVESIEHLGGTIFVDDALVIGTRRRQREKNQEKDQRQIQGNYRMKDDGGGAHQKDKLKQAHETTHKYTKPTLF